jgi:DNA-binding NarL/FixJ family response regulator
MTSPLHLLLLHDLEIAKLVEATLERSRWRVLSQRADSPNALKATLRHFAPDAVLSDHSLSDWDPKSAWRMLRTAHPVAPVIVVSHVLDSQTAVACLRCGADDLVLTSRLAQLDAALETAFSARTKLRQLSPRQLEILGLIAEGQTTRGIAQRLHISAKTVDTHRVELMRRLGIHEIAGLVRYAIRMGLVLPDS